MKERKRHISAWVVTQGAKPPWDQGSAISLLRDRNFLIPSNKCVPPHKLCSKQSKGHHVQNATVSGHWKPMPLPNPNTALLPSPINMGQGEAGHPSHWGMYYQGEGLIQTCPTHRRAHPQRSPSWHRGNQPRKEETKWLHLIFTLFSLLSLLSLLLHIAENTGSSKAKSISKRNDHVSILAKDFTGSSCCI